MLFNSLDYAVFLVLVFFLYWGLKKKLKLQNFLILVVSLIFYGWWDWRFLLLMVFTSLLDYVISLQLLKSESTKSRKLLLALSVGANLGLLGFFKYYNFFVDSFVSSFSMIGINLNIQTLNIILPVGISFYTFQTLSYTIDVYRKKLFPRKDIVSYLAFVSFFPQLVAGPIERASNLLPQFYKERQFDINLAKDGLKQILWGLFKKMVIADNCAPLVNDIFTNYNDHGFFVLFLGAILFAFQIYGDFSGYSDIAIGSAKLIGFSLMKNFNLPYFSRDIAEFWRRWHISLSTWFRDYVYIPLGGSLVPTKFLLIRNILVIFLVSGFWHGANWTFIFWGAINALFFMPLLLRNKNRKNLEFASTNRLLPNFKELTRMGSTFILVCFAWIFFRAENIDQAFGYVYNMRHFKLTLPNDILGLLNVIIIIIVLVSMEWVARTKDFPLQDIKLPAFVRWPVYIIVALLVIINGGMNDTFIYFQF